MPAKTVTSPAPVRLAEAKRPVPTPAAASNTTFPWPLTVKPRGWLASRLLTVFKKIKSPLVVEVRKVSSPSTSALPKSWAPVVRIVGSAPLAPSASRFRTPLPAD